MKEVMDSGDIFYDIYFKQLIYELNSAIDSLYTIKKQFEKLYVEKKFEKTLLKIFEEEEVSSNYFNDLKKVAIKLKIKNIKNIDIFNKIKEVYDININSISSNEEKARINENIKKICIMFKNMEENKIETKNINDFKQKFREKYGITKKDMSEDILEEILKKNEFDETKSIEEVINKLKH